MEAIGISVIGCLTGIFVGIATAGYMLIQQIRERDTTIDEKTNDFIQLNEEHNDLRNELEETKFDLSVANRKIGQKDEIIAKMQVVINDFMTKEDKLNKIKELADDYQSIN